MIRNYGGGYGMMLHESGQTGGINSRDGPRWGVLVTASASPP
jgi:hypothetical protein